MKGYYEPNCFHLKMNIDTEIDLNRLLQNENERIHFSTFVHEYVHFLQSISTYSGLLYFIQNVEELRHFLKLFKENPDTYFPGSFRIRDDTFLLNNRILNISNGNPNDTLETAEYIGYEQLENSLTDKDGNNLNIPLYKVTIKTDNIKSSLEEIHFGSYHLKEYMAFAIQRKAFPLTNNNDIPYKLVEKIIQKEHTHFNNDDYIISLCDVSLMYHNPPEMFFKSLELMKSKKWIPKKNEEIYEFCCNIFGVTINDFLEEFKSFSIVSKQCFGDIFKGDYFKYNVKWFNNLVDKMLFIRENNIDFLSKITCEAKIITPLFVDILSEIGTPFMTNKEWRGFYILPNSFDEDSNLALYFPLALSSILKTLRGKTFCCSLIDFCNNKDSTFVIDERCLNEPWERVHDKFKCPYAALLSSDFITFIPQGID